MDTFYKTTYYSPIGVIVLVSDGKNLNNNLSIFSLTKKWLDDYFNHKNPDISKLSLKFIQGTDFQKDVWEILLTIPHSKVLTYKDITEKLCLKKNLKKMSCQAVANAIAKNPILIIVPCHRVIASNGALRGYVAGVDIKEKLLKIENYNNSSSINLS